MVKSTEAKGGAGETSGISPAHEVLIRSIARSVMDGDISPEAAAGLFNTDEIPKDQAVALAGLFTFDAETQEAILAAKK